MNSNWKRTAAALAAVTAAALGWAGAANAQYPSRGLEEEAVMARTPDLHLSDSVLEAAGAYREFIGTVAERPAAFADGQGVAETVRTGAAYEPRQLAKGAVAYAAVVALQNPVFLRSVRRAGADPYSRRRVAEEIARNPVAATRFEGAEQAAGLILAAVGSDGSRLRDHGEEVRLAAYSVQLEAWSKDEIADREARLAEAKALSDRPLSASALELARLKSVVAGVEPLGVRTSGSARSYAPVVVRGLGLAALAALGEAGPGNEEAVERLLVEEECAECLRMSKLNLFQCLAVAGPWYEDIYCVGRHGLRDTGECLEASTREPVRRAVSYSGATPTPRRPEDLWRESGGWSRY